MNRRPAVYDTGRLSYEDGCGCKGFGGIFATAGEEYLSKFIIQLAPLPCPHPLVFGGKGEHVLGLMLEAAPGVFRRHLAELFRRGQAASVDRAAWGVVGGSG